jgi:hypothetical protein
MKISPGWLKQNIFFKIKNASQKIFTNTFLFQRFSLRMPFSVCTLLPPPPTGLCRGWGSSGSFQPQAVALVMAMKQ